MTSNQTYWLQRAERRIDNYTLASFDVARNIRRAYSSLQTYIESEMAKILRHIGGEDSLAYEYRMRRLAALLTNTEEKFKEVYGINLATTTAFLKEIVPEAYYHTIFDLAQGAGVQPEFAAIPDRLVNKIINENWSGKNYSKRIWANNKALEEEIRGLLTEAAVSGESIYKTSRKLADKFNTSDYNARRLIQTETVYACNQAEMESYEELEIDRYMYIATFDTRTCDICQKNDQKVFNRKDAVAGVNLAPMHPHCHCRTIPYFKEGMPIKKVARDKNGKNITIPANMKYDEWYEKYIEPYEGEKGTKKRTKPSKGKDTTPSRTIPQQPQEVPTIDVPAPSVGVPEYVEEKIPEKPLSIFEEAEQNRDKINAALHDVEEQRRGLNHEVGTIIDREGNIIEVINGGEHSVAVEDGVLNDLIFTHNHPSGGCFSDGDIKNMIEDNLLELRASTPQGTYHSLLRTPAASKESSAEFEAGFKKANSIVTATKQVQEDLKNGVITKQDVKDKGFNLYIEYMSKNSESYLIENAEKYGYIYTKGVI